jgi:LysR family hydrogen peroxide-inducible transcriptional activator
MLTLRQLQYLDALARHGSFRRAAEEYAVTQPAVSMQICKLEHELGTELVVRRQGVAVLTEAGTEVARRVNSILSATRDLSDCVRHNRRVLSGGLRLGVIPTLAPYVLPLLLPELQRRHPDLCLDLVESRTESLVSELARGALDVLLLALPVETPVFETTFLFRDRFLLAVPVGDPLPEGTRVSTRDVHARRLLLEEGHCLRDQALIHCGKHYAHDRFGATSLATVLQMVASGYGVTLLPEVAIDVEMRDDRVKLLRFVEPQPERNIGLAWRRTSPCKADFSEFGQILLKALKFEQPRKSQLILKGALTVVANR